MVKVYQGVELYESYDVLKSTLSTGSWYTDTDQQQVLYYFNMVTKQQNNIFETMANTSYNKAPPLLPSCKSCNAWKKLITLWTDLTILAKVKQGAAFVLSLKDKAQDAALELDSGETAGNDSVKIVIEGLNKIHEKVELTEKYYTIETSNVSASQKYEYQRFFLTEFNKRLHKTQSYKTAMSNNLLAYSLLPSQQIT